MGRAGSRGAGSGGSAARSRRTRGPVRSGSTVKEVAESLELAAPEVIKKLMELGEMATLTQTLSDEAIEVLAEAFDKKVEIVHAADEVERGADLRGHRRGADRRARR